MAFPFVKADLVRPPRVDARRAIALSLKLQRNVPDGASPTVRAACGQLATCTDALSVAWRAQGKTPPPKDNRAIVRALINAWSATHGRLAELTKLDPEEVPESAQARALIDAIFTQGLGFLQGEHDAIWIDSRDLLTAIDEGSHAADIDRLAGHLMLPTVRKAHLACGVALGLTSPAVERATVELKPLLDAVTESISTYALQLLASADAEDPDDVREVTHALAPLIDHRKRARARRNEVTDGEDNGEDSSVERATPTQGAPAPASPQPANDNPAQPAPARRVA